MINRKVVLSAFSLFLSLPLAADDPVKRQSTQDLGQSVVVTADVRHQVRSTPPMMVRAQRSKPKRAPLTRPGGPGELLDSIDRTVFVPAGEDYCLRYNARLGKLEEAVVPYTLTGAAWQAVAAAPNWLQADLQDKFAQLDGEHQDQYANLILDLTDPLIVDEVCFQVAHLSRTLLSNATVEPETLKVNAELMYVIDQDLQFVEIVDHDDRAGNFYSTTRYQYLDGGIPMTVELPADIYYWYVVMPKVSDERPLLDESVYDMFWREYLYYENDDGYPNLQEVMAPIQYLWDGETRWHAVGDPFTSDLLAVICVALWSGKTIDSGASGDRPIQPNIIAHGHNGNCGERQDLLCAAGRTCLMPYICTMDILEDHVWCEMWWDYLWRPTQNDPNIHFDNPYCSYEADSGGSKECSCIWDWRNDGFTCDAIATYSDTCTLTVAITDPNGVPVDNASVIIASEGWSTATIYRGTWGETDRNGQITFTLGDHQDYYIQVITDLGSFPASGYASIITDSQEDGTYFWEWSTPEPMPALELTEVTPPGDPEPFTLEVTYDLPCDINNGRDYYATLAGWYAERLTEGKLDFFVVTEENFQAYRATGACSGYFVSDAIFNHVTLDVSGEEDFYIVFSGVGNHGLRVMANVTANLWKNYDPELQAAEIVTGPGPGPMNPTLARVFEYASPGAVQAEWNCYGVQKFGVNVACGDIGGDLQDELISGAGPGAVFGPHVRGFDAQGTPLPGVSFMAYGTPRYGVNVSAGDIDGDGYDEIVTGAGPGAVFGPHVRGWNVDNGEVQTMAGVSYFAYGTLKYGVNVSAGDIDGDGYDEIVTGAGPGEVFGPHVRGWNVDGGVAASMGGVSFFAYGTLRWGVNVACGDLDGDGMDEIITGPGPGAIFGSHVRGWNCDGGTVSPLSTVSFNAYPGLIYGAVVGAADVDGDGFDEILTMPGPGADNQPELKVWNVDNGPVSAAAAFPAYDGMDLGHGGRVAGGHIIR
jgi:hypothetical protein